MRARPGLITVMAALALCLPASAESRQVRHRPPAAAVPARHPVSGLSVIPLTVDGHRFAVELAATPDQQETGLMFRTRMGADEGMIFPMSPPRQAYFWMRNTVLPLDIIFIGPDGRVLNVAANARPYDETPLGSAGKVGAVLELNAGRAAQLKIGPGSRVKW